MVEPKILLQASVEAGKEFFRPPHEEGGGEPPRAAPLMVPIRALGPGHRQRIAAHLLALESDDRYLRFGYAANDEQIGRYVERLDFERDDIFGVFNRRLELVAMAHLAYPQDDAQCQSCAEFGVSVAKKSRGKHLGKRLFDRAVMHARNAGVELLFIQALSENTAMLKIARNAGATLERDGAETEAYLRLPAATLDTHVAELVENQLAEVDYQLKSQAKRFWEFLAGLQEVRDGVREARRHSQP